MPYTPEDAASLERQAVAFQAALLGSLPHLNAFAASLCGCRDKAKDLAQEAVLRAWKNKESFDARFDIKPWLFAILRNVYFSDLRRTKLAPMESLDALTEGGWQQGSAPDLVSCEIDEALAQLPAEQREVLVLIVAEGLTYEEAAAVCNCQVGTIKSWLSRARSRLAVLLGANLTSHNTRPTASTQRNHVPRGHSPASADGPDFCHPGRIVAAELCLATAFALSAEAAAGD